MTTQLCLDDYTTARNRALEQVERNANEACSWFTTRAMSCVLDHLREYGNATGEQLTDACKKAGVLPHNDKAFGAILARLSRSKRIEKVGFAPRTKGHGTAGGIVWGIV